MAKNQNQPKKSKQFTGIKSSGLVILACLVLAVAIFHCVR